MRNYSLLLRWLSRNVELLFPFSGNLYFLYLTVAPLQIIINFLKGFLKLILILFIWLQEVHCPLSQAQVDRWSFLIIVIESLTFDQSLFWVLFEVKVHLLNICALILRSLLKYSRLVYLIVVAILSILTRYWEGTMILFLTSEINDLPFNSLWRSTIFRGYSLDLRNVEIFFL